MSKIVFSYGSWVWIPDEDDMFVPAKVEEAFEQGKPGKVNRDGHVLTLSEKDSKVCQRMDEQSLTSVDNMVELKELNEASILHNLRLRFKKDEIYTTVGTILVSVNPFKNLPLYTPEILDKYKNTGARSNKPHVFGVADEAYKNMVADGQNQSCIVSGESGAGKTEATKIFLQYIADISGSSKSKEDEKKDNFGKASLQEQILKANPLMEAFGNAKTKRNDNSSRFGKWIEVSFNNKRGDIISGSIVQYLLEKSRLVHQAEGERNYHIFYNLCAGAAMDTKVRDKFNVKDPESYHYLNQSGVLEVDTINDEDDWENVIGAMEVIGISNEEQDDILRTTAGILHLGNVEFDSGGGEFEEGSKILNKDVVKLTAEQLGADPEKLEKALCFRAMTTGKDTVMKVNNVEQANASRDALAKQIYAQLFEWLINRINKSLAAGSNTSVKKKEDKSIIGVLDIFGFETFEWNSFEQLCINYCNEKLQFHFNEHIFSLEQEEYRNEGIDVSQIVFQDNQPTLDLIEKKPGGIFSIIDEEMTVPRGTDETMLGKLTKAHEKHSNFRKPGVKTNYERSSFTIIHYAGAVMYNVTGFLEKNKDKLSPDLEGICTSSKIAFVKGLFEGKGSSKQTTTRGTQSGSKNSIATKFKNQLGALMQTLKSTQPHFIRCIKPNDEKAAQSFTSQMVIEQLRYAGLLEVCRIRQVGYPIRKNFTEFVRRYSPLVDGSPKDHKQLCMKLESAGLMGKGQWQIGKKKVFIRNQPYNDLEAAREVALKQQAIALQKIARRFVCRARYGRYQKTIANLRNGMQKRKYEALKEALSDAGDLPYQGKHLEVVKEATKVLARLEEERRVTKMLEDAIEKRDYSLLQGAIRTAEEMKFKSDVVTKAEKLKKLIEEERAAVKALNDAINVRKLDDLKVAMEKVKKLKLTSIPEWAQAEALKKRLEEEAAATKAVEDATKSRDLEKLKVALAKVAEMGIQNAVVDAGERVKKEILEETHQEDDDSAQKATEERNKKVEQMKKELKDAASSNDDAKVAEAKRKVLEMGVSGEEVDSLLKAATKLSSSKESTSELNAAVETLQNKCQSSAGISVADVATLEGVIDNAKSNGMDDSEPALENAMVMLNRAKDQIEAQKKLKAALATEPKNFNQLREALEYAQELDMETEDFKAVLDLVRDLNETREQDFSPREEKEMDEDEFERQRQENLRMASHERYNFRKYYKIRTDGDYVKNIMFNKKRVAEAKLMYQKTIIPRSILQFDKELNKMAIGVHKSLLGYCGEQLMSFPATLAQDILVKGLEQPELVDEIYIQIMKHLTNNPKPESVGRAWQLMCMAVGTFPPSSDFEYYLLNFLIEHLQVPGLVGNYARYSLRRLEGMLIRGASGFVPNIDEILSYKERPPILATIELVDGTPLTEDLPVTPDLNVDKVLEIAIHFLSLQDKRASSFGIFVKDSEEEESDDTPVAMSAYSAARVGEASTGPTGTNDPLANAPMRTPRPLRGKDYLGDVVVQMTRQRRQIHFIFKRKIFLPNEDFASDDPVYSRLMYLQAADEIISGNIPVAKEADVIQLTAIAIAADSEKFPSTEKALLEAELMEYIPLPWRSKKTDANWARAVLAARGRVASKPLDYLQNQYVDMAKKLPLWGHTFFFVRKEAEGNDMICSIAYDGIHFLSLSRVELQVFKYQDVHRWGGSSTQFWLLVWDAKKNVKSKMALFTSQARDMSSLILDYALLAAERKA